MRSTEWLAAVLDALRAVGYPSLRRFSDIVAHVAAAVSKIPFAEARRLTDSEFVGSLYTYPWDLTDGGLDTSLDRIVELTGCREIMLTPCYHQSTYFRPHNPKGPVYFGDNGAVYFAPELSRYAGTRMRPRVSAVVDHPEYFERIVEGIERRGLQLGAWVVYTFQTYLSQRYPQFAKHDAFGTAYEGQLSVASPDVQEYFSALTSDIVERFKPAAVLVESLMRRGFSVPAKRRAEISPQCQFLMALDFNPAAVANAGDEGMDAEGFRQEVREWLRHRLSRLPTGEDAQPVTDEWLAEAFDGRLDRYQEICRSTNTALWLRVAEIIRRGGAAVQADLGDEVRQRQNDLEPAINGSIDRVPTGALEPGEESARRVRDLKGRIAQNGEVYVTLAAGRLTDSGPLEAQVNAARDAGADGALFYNYGLLREEELGFIGSALRGLPE